MDLALSFWSAAWRAVLIQLVVLTLGGGAVNVLAGLDLHPLPGLIVWFIVLFPTVWFMFEWRRQFLTRRGHETAQKLSTLGYLFEWCIDLCLATLAAGAWVVVSIAIAGLSITFLPATWVDAVATVAVVVYLLGLVAIWFLVLAKCRNRRGHDWFETKAEREKRERAQVQPTPQAERSPQIQLQTYEQRRSSERTLAQHPAWMESDLPHDRER